MDAKLAEQRQHYAAGYYRGMSPFRTLRSPTEMGFGPVFAIPKLLERHRSHD